MNIIHWQILKQVPYCKKYSSILFYSWRCTLWELLIYRSPSIAYCKNYLLQNLWVSLNIWRIVLSHVLEQAGTSLHAQASKNFVKTHLQAGSILREFGPFIHRSSSILYSENRSITISQTRVLTVIIIHQWSFKQFWILEESFIQSCSSKLSSFASPIITFPSWDSIIAVGRLFLRKRNDSFSDSFWSTDWY